MPKHVIDYSNTIFYKIYCKDERIKELYIGHTTNFVQRKYGHKRACTNDKDMTCSDGDWETFINNVIVLVQMICGYIIYECLLIQ